jgi:hypothetical protein
MSGGTGKEREERAADALLVSALRPQDSEGTDVDAKNLPQLTDEEKAAMKALGSNFIQRLLAGERPLGEPAVPQESDPDECEELAAASRMSGSSGSLISPPASSPASPDLSAQGMARSLLTGAFLGQEVTQAHPTLQPESPRPALAVLVASESGRAGDASGTTSSVTLPGQNLSADGKGRRLSYWQSVARIGVQVADALEYAHSRPGSCRWPRWSRPTCTRPRR